MTTKEILMIKKNIRGSSAFKLLCLLLLGVAQVWGQSALSQISGTVHDPNGALVPGAQVTVTQTATGLVRTVNTGSDGAFVLPSLPVGPYRMTVAKEGFTTYVQSGIVLQVDSHPEIEATLNVGSIAQQVEVQANANMVETQSTSVGQVIDQQRVVELPLNGRQATQLVFIAGAATVAEGGLNSNKNYPTVTISVAGGTSSSVTYNLDGGNHNDPFTNLNQPLPFPDALQEFKVETSALPAQYGYHASAAVNAVTKQGSNEFHGNLFEFIRNGDLNARNFFATSRDTLKRNQYGGTVGGPILHNKLFFFAGYQGTIQRSDPTNGIGFGPTPQMLAGDFTDIASAACNGGRGITLASPFVNNKVSPSLFSPAAVALAKHLPVPSDVCGTIRFGTVSNSDEHLGLGRVDYQISQKHTLFGRYYIANLEQSSSYNNNNPMTVTAPFVSDRMQFFTLGDTYLFSSTIVNSFHATLNRAAITKGSPAFFSAADLGVNMTPMVPGFVVIQVTGAFNAGSNASPPGHVFTTTPQLNEDLSIVHGSHQIQMGVNWIRPMGNIVINLATFGNFNFNGQITGLSMGDLLLGKLNTFQQANPALSYPRSNYIGMYLQDTWRVTSHLTLNYGLRWEPYLANQAKHGFVSHFDTTAFAANVHSSVFPQAPAGLTFPGDPGYPGNGASFSRKAQFAPRLGVVWDPQGNGRMTIRASYGILYDLPPSLFDYQFSLNPPWGDTVTRTRPEGGFDDPWAGFPGGNPFPTTLGKNAFFPAQASYVNMPLHVKPTYVQQWNLSVQRQIGTDWLVSGSYIGNRTVHLWSSTQLNPAVYVPGNSTTGNTDARRLLTFINPVEGPKYQGFYQLDDGASASYNGMLLSAQRRMAHGVTVLANYTWSHCIAEPVDSVLGTTANYMNPNDRRADRGSCFPSDRRHLLNLSAVAMTPTFSNRILRAAASDWRVGAIVSAQSGSPINVTTGVDNALTGQANQRPNLVANAVPQNQNVDHWLLASAFQAAPAGTYGNLGINSFTGPGALTFDTSVSRLFRIHEHQSLELRGEAFNVLNRLNANNPTSALNSATFGRVLSAADPRIMQLAMKFAF
jgi:hypothetical protein